MMLHYRCDHRLTSFWSLCNFFDHSSHKNLIFLFIRISKVEGNWAVVTGETTCWSHEVPLTRG